MAKLKIQNLYLTAIAAVLLLIHFHFFHSGYFGYDELEYTQLAVELLRGEFDHGQNLYAYRWAIIFPLAVFYSLFGIGDFANMLPTLLSLLAIVYITLDILKDSPFSSKLMAVFFIVCTPIHLMYLAKPMPDVLVELGFLLCFAAYYRITYSSGKSLNPAVPLFVFGAILIFLSKETFLIIYPFFLVLIAIDLWKRERWQFWIKVVFLIFAFLLFYFLYFWISAGNPLARVEALFHDRYTSECTYDLQPIEVLLRRVAYGMWFNFMKFGALIPIGFMFLLSKKYALSQGERFIFCSYLAVLLLSNFMTISYTSYVPLCDDTRHFLFVFPIAAMVAVIGFSHLSKMGLLHRSLLVVTLLIQWYITTSVYPENYYFIYIPVAIGVLFWGKFNVKWPWALLVISGLFYQYISNVQYHRILNFPEQKKLIEYVLEKKAPAVIVTDPANSRIGNFYAGYRPEKHLFLSYKAYSDLDSLPEGPVFFISNGMTSYHSNINWEEVPREITDAPQQLDPVMKNEAGEVYLLLD